MVFIFHRIRIDNALKTLTDDYNQKIHTAMKDMGITYVPFMLDYQTDSVPTGLPPNYKRAVKSIKIDIDADFLKSYFARKVSFEQWLSKNHNTVAREHYRFMNKMQPDDHPHIDNYFKKFELDVPIAERGQTVKDQTSKSGHVIAHVMENSQRGADRWKGFTGADVDKFIENENYLFSNNMRMFLVSQDSDGKIKEILKKVLSEFNEAFMNLDLSEIAYEGEEDDPVSTFRKNPKGSMTTAQMKAKYQPNKEWLETMTGEKQTWNQARPIKFPNIPNILDWFMRTGIYKSVKRDEFLNIKTVKGRKNWIDRSVFLIANGVYAKALGQSTTFASGKVRQNAGAKIPISQARKYKRFSKEREKYNSKRQQNLAEWKVDIRKLAAGYRNSGEVYSRVNRKRGNTSRMDKRKDNRV